MNSMLAGLKGGLSLNRSMNGLARVRQIDELWANSLLNWLRGPGLSQPYARTSAVLRYEFQAGVSEHAFDNGHRVLVSGVTTDLNVCDRISMQTRRLGEIPNGPI
jgi:hypothetical protein